MTTKLGRADFPDRPVAGIGRLGMPSESPSKRRHALHGAVAAFPPGGPPKGHRAGGGVVVTADEERALRERAVVWVERSCAEQGVPVKLSDPLALAGIAEILGSARDARSGER
jgi:hypothetical protein